jgi:hypothetical protein
MLRGVALPAPFRKNSNLFDSHRGVLWLLLRKESAIVKATKRNPTEGEPQKRNLTQGDEMKELVRRTL